MILSFLRLSELPLYDLPLPLLDADELFLSISKQLHPGIHSQSAHVGPGSILLDHTTSMRLQTSRS